MAHVTDAAVDCKLKTKKSDGLKAQLPENKILEVPKNNGTSGVGEIFDL